MLNQELSEAHLLKLFEAKKLKQTTIYMERIINFEPKIQKLVINTLVYCLVEHKTTAIGMISALYFYRELVLQAQFDTFQSQYFSEKIHQEIYRACLYNSKANIKERGRNYLKQILQKQKIGSKQKDIESLGTAYIRLCLQIIYKMSQWYPVDYITQQPSRFKQYHDKLVAKQVIIPTKQQDYQYMGKSEEKKFRSNYKIWKDKIDELQKQMLQQQQQEQIKKSKSKIKEQEQEEEKEKEKEKEKQRKQKQKQKQQKQKQQKQLKKQRQQKQRQRKQRQQILEKQKNIEQIKNQQKTNKINQNNESSHRSTTQHIDNSNNNINNKAQNQSQKTKKIEDNNKTSNKNIQQQVIKVISPNQSQKSTYNVYQQTITPNITQNITPNIINNTKKQNTTPKYNDNYHQITTTSKLPNNNSNNYISPKMQQQQNNTKYINHTNYYNSNNNNNNESTIQLQVNKTTPGNNSKLKNKNNFILDNDNVLTQVTPIRQSIKQPKQFVIQSNNNHKNIDTNIIINANNSNNKQKVNKSHSVKHIPKIQQQSNINSNINTKRSISKIQRRSVSYNKIVYNNNNNNYHQSHIISNNGTNVTSSQLTKNKQTLTDYRMNKQQKLATMVNMTQQEKINMVINKRLLVSAFNSHNNNNNKYSSKYHNKYNKNKYNQNTNANTTNKLIDPISTYLNYLTLPITTIPFLQQYFHPITQTTNTTNLFLQSLKLYNHPQHPQHPLPSSKQSSTYFYSDQYITARIIKLKSHQYILSIHNIVQHSIMNKNNNIIIRYSKQLQKRYQQQSSNNNIVIINQAYNIDDNKQIIWSIQSKQFIDIPFHFYTVDPNFKFLKLILIIEEKIINMWLPITLLDQGYVCNYIDMDKLIDIDETNGRIIRSQQQQLSYIEQYNSNNNNNNYNNNYREYYNNQTYTKLPSFLGNKQNPQINRIKMIGQMTYHLPISKYQQINILLYITTTSNPSKHNKYEINAIFNAKQQQSNQDYAKVLIQLLCLLLNNNNMKTRRGIINKYN